MSIRVMSLVWDNFNRGGSEKLAMLALADWCNDLGGSLYPSIASVAKKINTSDCQARRIVHGLIDEGYLSVVGNHAGGNPGQARQYQMNLKKLSTPSMDATPSVDATPSMDATPSVDATPSMDARLPLAPMRVTPSARASLTINKPSVEPPIDKPAKAVSFNAKTRLEGLGVGADLIADFLAIRKAKQKPLTETAIKGIIREAGKAGWSIEQAVTVCCERGWQSFQAKYVEGEKPAPAEAIPFDRAAYDAKKKADMAAAREAYKRDQAESMIPARATK